jgi:hypothetical protein
MADPIVDTDPVGGPAPSEAAFEPWKDLGFESAADMVKEFTKQKTDIAKYKPDARKASELETQLAALQKAEEERQAAEMSDLEKQTKALEKARAETLALQAKFDKAQKDIVYERAVARRLSVYAETDRDLVRSLYDAAGEFADEDELNSLLDVIDTKWKAHMDAYGGENRPDVGGSSRGRAQVTTPASKDEVQLAHDIAGGGAMGLLRRKFGKE